MRITPPLLIDEDSISVRIGVLFSFLLGKQATGRRTKKADSACERDLNAYV